MSILSEQMDIRRKFLARDAIRQMNREQLLAALIEEARNPTVLPEGHEKMDTVKGISDALKYEEHQGIAFQPFRETTEDVFSNITEAKLAIADAIGKALAKISQEDRDFIDSLLQNTLDRKQVLQEVRDYFRKTNRKGEKHHAG